MAAVICGLIIIIYPPLIQPAISWLYYLDILLVRMILFYFQLHTSDHVTVLFFLCATIQAIGIMKKGNSMNKIKTNFSFKKMF